MNTFTSFALPGLAALLLALFSPTAALAQDCSVTGGTLTFTDLEGDSTSICAGDGVDDLIDVTLSGATGDSMIYVITDDNFNILALPAGPPFNLEDADGGTCLIWHLSYDSIGGAALGARADSLTGCFELSNPLTVLRDGVDGGILSLATGGDSTTICAGDSISDAFDVVLTDTMGANSAWVITDDSLNILGLPAGPPFDLEGAGPGLCYIWHLSYGDSLPGGATVGANAADLTGCFDLSNQIFVTRDTGVNCVTTAVEAPLDPGTVALFPNPTGSTLTLDLNDLTSGRTTIQVLDLTGRLVEQRILDAANGRHAFDLTAAPAGTYLLRVRNDGKALTRRFVKQ